METVQIIKEYEKGLQTVRIIQDNDGDQYIQIMDELHPNTPVWEGDTYQAEEILSLLTKAIKEII